MLVYMLGTEHRRYLSKLFEIICELDQSVAPTEANL